ncbi:MAG: isopeptide-forming domain-containing fimbrial protein, partial [Bacillota bacterium]|nr:isopeptide-forming domain-containing fimbrial protein [Bacillota bacterium]
MKKMKKLVALLMTVAMVMGMAMTTMAAPTGTIKVKAPDGTVIKYAPIIQEDRTAKQGWKFVDSIEDAFVKAYLNKENVTEEDAELVIARLIETKKLEKNSENENIKSGLVTTNADYNRALNAIRENATSVAQGGEFTPNAIGLYLITASKTGYTFQPMAAYVGENFSGLEVTAKGSNDQIEKKVGEDGQSVSKGDLVSYTVTVEYPYYPENATNTKFIVTDTLTNATFEDNKDLQITVDGETFDSSKYEAKVNGEKTTLTIDFGKFYDATYAGKTVTITYKATVGDVTSETPLKNSAKSETETGATVKEIESDTAKFKVIKVDETNREIKLGGAEFTLYVEDENGTETIVYNNKEHKVNIVETKATSSEEKTLGEVVFDGLDAQKTYYVKETKAPEGYSLNETVYLLQGATITSKETESTDEVTKITTKKITYTATDFNDQTVEDTKLSSLPSTGGIGTTI